VSAVPIVAISLALLAVVWWYGAQADKRRYLSYSETPREAKLVLGGDGQAPGIRG